jgi:hypothetical protein
MTKKQRLDIKKNIIPAYSKLIKALEIANNDPKCDGIIKALLSEACGSTSKLLYNIDKL